MLYCKKYGHYISNVTITKNKPTMIGCITENGIS